MEEFCRAVKPCFAHLSQNRTQAGYVPSQFRTNKKSNSTYHCQPEIRGDLSCVKVVQNNLYLRTTLGNLYAQSNHF